MKTLKFPSEIYWPLPNIFPFPCLSFWVFIMSKVVIVKFDWFCHLSSRHNYHLTRYFLNLMTNVTLTNVCLLICVAWWTSLWQNFNANVLSFSRLEKQARLLVFLPLHFLFWDENWPFWRLSECQIPGVAKMRRALSVHAILHSIYIRTVSS